MDRDHPEGDTVLDSISLTDNKTHEQNPSDVRSESGPAMEQDDSTQHTGKDTSVLSSVTTLIQAAKAQQEQYQLDMADPVVVDTMEQIQTLRNNLKTLRQTNRILMKERNKDLGIISQHKIAKGRELWLKTQNNKRNPYVLKEYREELLKLSLPEHDTSNPTLMAETKLLRAQHNEWITERQMNIMHKLQQNMIDYMYNDALPNIKNEAELAITVGREQVDKIKMLKNELGKVYQKHAQTQEAILAKYREKMPPEMSAREMTNPDVREDENCLQDSDSNFGEVLLTRKGKKERSLGQSHTLKSTGQGEKNAARSKDDQSQNLSQAAGVDADLLSLSESISGFDSTGQALGSSSNEMTTTSINSSRGESRLSTSPVLSPHRENLTLSESVRSLEATSSILSPQLSPRTGIAARIAERRRASVQQQSNPEQMAHPTTESADPGENNKYVKISDISKSEDIGDTLSLSPNDEFQRREPQRTASLSDRRSVGGRIGVAATRASRSGLLERARSARLQGAAANDVKELGGARPITTIPSRPTLTSHRSLSTRDVGGSSRVVRPSLSSSLTNESRVNSRRNLVSGMSSRQLIGNGESASGLSEERRAEIRNQLRNNASKGNTASSSVTNAGTAASTRPIVTKTLSKRFERVTDESDEDST